MFLEKDYVERVRSASSCTCFFADDLYHSQKPLHGDPRFIFQLGRGDVIKGLDQGKTPLRPCYLRASILTLSNVNLLSNPLVLTRPESHPYPASRICAYYSLVIRRYGAVSNVHDPPFLGLWTRVPPRDTTRLHALRGVTGARHKLRPVLQCACIRTMRSRNQYHESCKFCVTCSELDAAN